MKRTIIIICAIFAVHNAFAAVGYCSNNPGIVCMDPADCGGGTCLFSAGGLGSPCIRNNQCMDGFFCSMLSSNQGICTPYPDCSNGCTDCESTSWSAHSTGYEKRTTATCNTTTCVCSKKNRIQMCGRILRHQYKWHIRLYQMSIFGRHFRHNNRGRKKYNIVQSAGGRDWLRHHRNPYIHQGLLLFKLRFKRRLNRCFYLHHGNRRPPSYGRPSFSSISILETSRPSAVKTRASIRPKYLSSRT